MVKKVKKKKKNKKKKKSKTNQPKVDQVLDAAQEKPEIPVSHSFEDNQDDQDERIYTILDINVDEDDEEVEEAAVTHENLIKFFEYLEREITLPVVVTGAEDMGCFRWESFYAFGPGKKEEYAKLRKEHPSFRDKYQLLSFSEDFDEEEGILGNVLRISDNKKFTLPLADLETVEKKTKNEQLLNDYVVWFVNFR